MPNENNVNKARYINKIGPGAGLTRRGVYRSGAKGGRGPFTEQAFGGRVSRSSSEKTKNPNPFPLKNPLSPINIRTVKWR